MFYDLYFYLRFYSKSSSGFFSCFSYLCILKGMKFYFMFGRDDIECICKIKLFIYALLSS